MNLPLKYLVAFILLIVISLVGGIFMIKKAERTISNPENLGHDPKQLTYIRGYSLILMGLFVFFMFYFKYLR